MADFRKLAIATILADGTIDDTEVKILGKELKGTDGKITDEGIKFLVDLRNTAQKKAKAKKESLNETFEKFFFKVVTDNVLKDGKIDAKEAHWLRSMLFADGKIDANEKKFLARIKKGAKKTSPEFDKLYNQCMAKK